MRTLSHFEDSPARLEQVTVNGRPWNKQAPAPALPNEVIQKTAAKYREALTRLTGA